MKESIRVLLIEDNPGDARLVKEALTGSGEHQYILTWVPDLATGLAQIASHPFDAILLDLGLPDSTGIDTFEKVYTQAPGIPVILLTGLDDDALASRVMRLGAQDYIVKGEVMGRVLKRVIRYAIERKRSEESLRKSESLKAAILESALDCMITIDHLGRIIEFNPAAQATFGYSIHEVLGKELVELIIPPSLRAQHRRGLKRYLDTGESNILGKRIELTGMRADGSEFPVELTVQRVTGSDPPVFTSFLRDITERKRAEEALREREQRLSSIYDTAADIIFHLTVEEEGGYRFTSVNLAFLSVTGLSYDQVVGRRVDEVIPEPSLTLVLGYYETAIREKRIVRWEETSDYPTGRLTGEVSVAPVFDDAGHCTHLVGAVHDLTERKRAEEALKYSEERLNAIIEQSPLSIQVFSPDGTCVRANRGWEELWGSRREQLVGYNVLADPQVKERGIFPYLQKAFAGEIVSIPPVYYDPAEIGQVGKARWTKAVMYPVKDANRQIREVVLTHEDITERVQVGGESAG